MRKLTTLTTLLVVLCFTALKAQDPFKSFMNAAEKYGFKNAKGVIIVQPKYDNIRSKHSEGLQGVNIGDNGYTSGGKWGFIDFTGKEVIPLKYDMVKDFSEGKAAVRIGGKWAYIDKTGKELTPFQYTEAEDFANGKASVVLNGETIIINDPLKKEGNKPVSPQKPNSASTSKAGNR